MRSRRNSSSEGFPQQRFRGCPLTPNRPDRTRRHLWETPLQPKEKPSVWAVPLRFSILLLLATHPANAQTPFTLEDIEFWTGTGSHASALVIDWHGADNTDQSLAWGYRWESISTTEEMLRSVIQADGRLYAKLSSIQPLGISVYGIGYDTDENGIFAISDGTSFDPNGIAVSGTGAADGATAMAPDEYAEGWFDTFWHFGKSDGNPFAQGGGWVTGGGGLSGRTLVDGSWDSLAFDVDFSFDDYAKNPSPAPRPHVCDLNSDVVCDADDIEALYSQSWGLPPNGPVFDLNGDNVVDSADLDQWLIGAGEAHEFGTVYLRGDGNLDRRIDITDFNALAANFAPAGSATIPRWDSGNFDGNAQIDITDFNFLADNFSPSGYLSTGPGILANHNESMPFAVPEPDGNVYLIAFLSVSCWLWVWRRSSCVAFSEYFR